MCVDMRWVSFSAVTWILWLLENEGGVGRGKPHHHTHLSSNNINKMRSLSKDKHLLRLWGNSACWCNKLTSHQLRIWRTSSVYSCHTRVEGRKLSLRKLQESGQKRFQFVNLIQSWDQWASLWVWIGIHKILLFPLIMSSYWCVSLSVPLSILV